MPTLRKVISGGQTGADRAGLEAAAILGIETGGWAPTGFATAKGKDPSLSTKFHLKELIVQSKSMSILAPPIPCDNVDNVTMSQMYVLRSQKNVDDSDGTIAFRLKSSVGTDKTIGYCLTRKWAAVANFGVNTSYKPCLVITNIRDPDNVINIRKFIGQNRITVINIAGHRDEVIEGFSKCIIDLLVESLVSQ